MVVVQALPLLLEPELEGAKGEEGEPTTGLELPEISGIHVFIEHVDVRL